MLLNSLFFVFIIAVNSTEQNAAFPSKVVSAKAMTTRRKLSYTSCYMYDWVLFSSGHCTPIKTTEYYKLQRHSRRVTMHSFELAIQYHFMERVAHVCFSVFIDCRQVFDECLFTQELVSQRRSPHSTVLLR